MRPLSPRSMWHFTRVYYHTQTTVHMHLTNHGYFDRGKNTNTPILAPCRNKDGAGSGISGLYLWGLHIPL